MMTRLSCYIPKTFLGGNNEEEPEMNMNSLARFATINLSGTVEAAGFTSSSGSNDGSQSSQILIPDSA